MKRGASLVLILVVAILCMGMGGLGGQPEGTIPETDVNIQAEVKDRGGVVTTLEKFSMAGKTSLDAWRGQVVLLNFWASWCEPCRAEAALLESTWRREAGGDIMFLGLDYLDQEHAALEYLAEFDITYPNGPDKQSAAARTYGIKGVPETFFIGPDGQIVSQVIGPIVSQADLDRRLDEIRP